MEKEKWLKLEAVKEFSIILVAFLMLHYIFKDIRIKLFLSALISLIYIINYKAYLKKNYMLYKHSRRFYLFALLLVFTTAFIKVLSTESIFYNQENLVYILGKNLKLGKLIYFVMCFVTPYIVIMSEPFSIMTGNLVFSTFWAFFLGYFGTILGIVSLFFIFRKKGDKYIKKLINNKQLSKYREFVARNEGLYLTILFVFPLLPDGVICAGAGLSDIKWEKFFVIAFLSKGLTVGVYSFFVDWLERNQLPISLWSIIGGIAAVYLVFLAHKRRRVRKSKEKGTD